MIKQIKQLIEFSILLTIVIVTVAVINSPKKVFADFQCCDLPNECGTQQCNPCGPSDGGQLRVAGQRYNGVRAGYSHCSGYGWAISYQGGNCSPGFYLCTIWTTCTCGGSAPPPTTCFPAKTKIAMSDGSEKNIEDVKVGDYVLSFDEKLNSKKAFKVLELESPIREGFYTIKLKDGTFLEVTNEHPIFVKKAGTKYEGWGSLEPEFTDKYYSHLKLNVKNIAVGDSLLNKNKNWIEITSIEYTKGSIQTYNLKTVEGANTFFAQGYYVHNKGEPPPPPGGNCDGGCHDNACDAWCKGGGCACGTCSPKGVCRCWKGCLGGAADNNGCNNSCAPVNPCAGKYCGNGACDTSCGESAVNCAADCCTKTAPATPTPSTPVNTTVNKSSMNSVNFGWTNGAWGQSCGAVNKLDAITVTYPAGGGSLSTGWFTSLDGADTRVLDLSASKCNGTASWGVTANNGALSSATATSSFTVAGYTGPTTIINSVNPTGSVAYPSSVVINVSATDPDSNLSWIRLYRSVGGVPVAIGNTITCPANSGSCSGNITWNPTCSDSGNQTIFAMAADSCGYTSAQSSSYTINTGHNSPNATISSVSSNNVGTGAPVTFNISATDADKNIASISLYKDAGTLVQTVTCPGTACSCATDGTCTAAITWTPVCADGGDHTFYAVARDACSGVSPNSPTQTVSVQRSYGLQVTVRNAGTTPNCSSLGGTVSNARVSVYAKDTGTQIGTTQTTTGAGTATITGITEEDTPVVAYVSYDDSAKKCDSYSLRCNGTESVAGSAEIDFTGTPVCTNKSVTLGISEEVKEAWEVVVDGDIYGSNITVPISCGTYTDTVANGFKPFLINKNSINGYVRASEDIDGSNVVGDGEGGYTKNLGNSSKDVWIGAFRFPTTDELSSIDTLGDFNSIRQGNVYKMTVNSFNNNHGAYNSIGSGAAIVYVYKEDDGDEINIQRNTTTTSDGILTVVTDAKVNVSGSVGISTYITTPASYSSSAPANIRLGIVSTNDIVINNGTPAYPVIIEGFLVSQGGKNITFGRDLDSNNSEYPAEVVRFYSKATYYLTKLVNSNTKAGLSAYDVQWIYGKEEQ